MTFVLLMAWWNPSLAAVPVDQVTALSSSALTSIATPVPRVRIYFQGQEFGSDSDEIVRRLNANGFNASAEASGIHQLPQWVNSVRYFHHEDAATAVWIRDMIYTFFGKRWKLTALDLTDAFNGIKIRGGSIEIWICDPEKNKNLPQDAHEPLFANWTPPPWPTAPVYAAADDVTVTPVPDDQYCMGWERADRSLFLDKQEGIVCQNDSDSWCQAGQEGYHFGNDSSVPNWVGKEGKAFMDRSASADRDEFLFIDTPARHDHGAPMGSCGTRIVVFKKDSGGQRVPCGFWEDLDMGAFYMKWPGDHHCVFAVSGANTPRGFEFYMIDETGRVLGTVPDPSMGEAVWVNWDGGEAFWQMDSDGITMRTPEGKVLWAVRENGEEFKGSFFSADRHYAFRELKQMPDGAIYSQDGKQIWRFKLPFRDQKAQKGFLGMNDQGELVLRVDRNIYRVDHAGNPHLEATLPVYKGRHRAIEDQRPGMNFNVEWDFGVNHRYDFETIVPGPHDHPRPCVRFNIDTFDAEESLDEGKNWHLFTIKANNSPN